MRELELISDEGEMKGRIRAFDLLADPENENEVGQGITKEEYYDILDKASQPINPKLPSDLLRTMTTLITLLLGLKDTYTKGNGSNNQPE